MANKNPHEVWSRKHAYIANLTVFGYDTFMDVPMKKRSKLDNKGEKISFLVTNME